jgi:hypothetical protein
MRQRYQRGYIEEGLRRNLKAHVEKTSLDLEGEKEITDAIGMLRMTSRQTLDIDEDLCTCFID